MNTSRNPVTHSWLVTRRRVPTRSAPRLELLETRTLLATSVLDPSFLVSPQTLPVGFTESSALSLQADDKILIGGEYAVTKPSGAQGTDFAVIRLLSTGALDTTFGQGGLVHVDLGTNGRDRADSIAIAPDGSIIVAGASQPADTFGFSTFAMIRLQSTGALDTTFGTEGFVEIDLSSHASMSSDSISISSTKVLVNGRIVLVGTDHRRSGHYAFNTGFLGSFNSAGTPSTGFGNGIKSGDVSLPGNLTISSLRDVFPAANGDFIVVGDSLLDFNYGVGGTYAPFVAAFKPDGTLDTSYAGLIGTKLPGDGTAQTEGSILGSDGSLLFFFGAKMAPTDSVLRLSPQGDIDPSFGTGGIKALHFAGISGSFYDALALRDGSISLLGNLGSYSADDISEVDALLAHVKSDLTVDQSFGQGGWMSPHPSSPPLISYGLVAQVEQSNGGLILALKHSDFNDPLKVTALIRLLPAGLSQDTIQFTDTQFQTTMSAGSAVVAVSRSSSMGITTVDYATIDGTAEAGADYSPVTGTLTFAAGEISKTITIPTNPRSETLHFGVVLGNVKGAEVLNGPGYAVVQFVAPQSVPPKLAAAALAITHSTEADQVFVNHAYETYLGRLPDSSGLDYWVRQMLAGLRGELIEARFLGSSEYIANHGGTGAGWVTGMYHDLLGRGPDMVGLEYWTSYLAAGGSPTGVALGFAGGAEREGQHVQALYQTFLDRSAGSAEVAFWVNQFLSGAYSQDLAAAFVASPEYYQNAAKGKSLDIEWVRSVYREVFERDPVATDAYYWSTVIR